MGRTVPSLRAAQMEEVAGRRESRRSLPKMEREAFDRTPSAGRPRASASSLAVRASRLEGVAMALPFRDHERLSEPAERAER